jgi:acetyl esterase/lipase
MKSFLLTVVALSLALFAFTKIVDPPRQLSLINSLWPGDGDAKQVAEGVVFDPKSGLKLDVWAPEKPTGAVLIFYYGGGWAHGTRDGYAFVGKAFAAKGFTVVIPDYRKVPQVRFPTFVEDGAAAIKWTRDNIAKYGGDPARITLSGHSAGAHIAMMLTLDPHYLQAQGVDPKIIRATVGMSGPYDFYPFDSARSINAMSAWPNPQETQPIHYASKAAPPIMVMTGTEDDTVKPRNAILLAHRLSALGTVVTFKAYEGLSHEDVAMALSKVFRGKAPVLDDAADFLTAQSGTGKVKGER